MGDVIDFQEWKEKKEQEQVFREIDNIFLATAGPGGLEIKYFVTTDLLGNPYLNFEYTIE